MTPAEEEVLTDYSADGVDLTLIRWMLALSPAERLQFAQRFCNRVLQIRQLNGISIRATSCRIPLKKMSAKAFVSVCWTSKP